METDNYLNQNQEPKILLSSFYYRRKILKIALLFTVSILVLFGILTTLNYFNLFPMPFLPKKEAAKKTEKMTVSCPAVKKFCQKNNRIVKQGSYIGLGANLPDNSPIYAAFDGQIQVRTISIASDSAKSTKEILTKIELISEDKKLSAIYIFKTAKTAIGNSFKDGQEITKITDEQVSSLDNNNFIFNLSDSKGQTVLFDKFTFR